MTRTQEVLQLKLGRRFGIQDAPHELHFLTLDAQEKLDLRWTWISQVQGSIIQSFHVVGTTQNHLEGSHLLPDLGLKKLDPKPQALLIRQVVPHR